MSKKKKDKTHRPQASDRVSTHPFVRKRRIFKRKFGYTLWEYNGDGIFARERIKGKDKKHLQRWWYRRRGSIQKDIDEQYEDYLDELAT